LGQDGTAKPAAKIDRPDAEKAPALRAKPLARGEGKRPKPADDDDFDGPSAKPPRLGDLDGPRPKPRRGDDVDGPPPKPPRDRGFNGPRPKPGRGDDFDGPRPKPERDGDFDGPPRKPPREGEPRRQGLPSGLPRWPYDDWPTMEKTDPEIYKLLEVDWDLERQTRAMALQYRRAPADQREKIKKQIETLIDKHFDVRQQRRSLELKRLEDELKRLREAMDRREKARKEIVEKRVNTLLGPLDEVGF
jgi:hypothetical protein